jgi:hypothetical protein
MLMLISGLSLGVIPMRSCDQFGYTFDFRRSSELPARHVDTRFELPYLYWWFAPALIVLPQFSAPPPASSGPDRERQGLRAAIIDSLAQ